MVCLCIDYYFHSSSYSSLSLFLFFWLFIYIFIYTGCLRYVYSRFISENRGGNLGPLKWPARSPDLNPLAFYLWGFLKQTVYLEQSRPIEELEENIRIACNAISPETLTLVTSGELLKRFTACSEAAGRHFEQLLSLEIKFVSFRCLNINKIIFLLRIEIFKQLLFI